MFEKLRNTLVSSYVGAIGIGWILADAALRIAYGFSAPVTQWIARHEYRELANNAWPNQILLRDAVPDLVRALGLLIMGYFLLRWLYMRPAGKKDEVVQPEMT